MSTRRYAPRWTVVIDIDEPEGLTREQRHNYQEELMLKMHMFLADNHVGEELRAHLGEMLDGRRVEHVLVAPLSVTHPDNEGPTGGR